MVESVPETRRIVLGVAGGIACYKALELVRLLVQDSFSVQVVMTPEAREFVTPLSFQTLSGRPVATELFSLTQESEIGHINIADTADLVVIAPATANIIGKIASGIADDLLTTIVLATRAPLLIVPAMNVHMLANSVVQANIAKLRSAHYRIMEPAEGDLACGYQGKGRLPEPWAIRDQIHAVLGKEDLKGERLLVTAGPNHEAIDPVRFISNRSSGKMGYALARAAVRRGADVTLVSGPTALPPPAGVRLLPVVTAAQMREAVLAEFDRATAVFMAAAVADYRPAAPPQKKVKRGRGVFSLELRPNPDILGELGRRKQGRVLVGFAAETDSLILHAKEKLRRKKLDFIVANDVTKEGCGFDVDTNAATLIDREDKVLSLPLMSKDALADRIYDYFLDWKAKRRKREAVSGATARSRRSEVGDG